MRVVLYEWCMSGGLAGGSAAIVREGRMMLEALAADAAKNAALEIVVLVEVGRAVELPRAARIVPVPVGADTATLGAAAREADWTVIVAPESDSVLADRVRAARAAGGRVLAPAAHAIDVASDKQATIDVLAARGVPVPAGRSLAAGAAVPAGFRLPAVRKARDGCGGDALEILESRDVPPAAVPTRIEALATGTPVGVSCICGPHAPAVLPPLRQSFTAGPRPRYLGSDLLLDAGLATRAATLARRTVAALGLDAGWAGVDLVLGDRPDGRDDRVLEVNPRVTTSFVGLARLYAASLLGAMIDAATGSAVPGPPAVAPAATAASFRLPGA